MALSQEIIGSKILAKIKICILARAELLCNLCFEVPCMFVHFTMYNWPVSKIRIWIRLEKQIWPQCGYLAGKAHASKRPKLQILQTTGTFPMIAT